MWGTESEMTFHPGKLAFQKRAFANNRNNFYAEQRASGLQAEEIACVYVCLCMSIYMTFSDHDWFAKEMLRQ